MYCTGKYDYLNTLISKYTEYDLFEHSLGHTFELGKRFNSPLREDNNPSFNIFQLPDGKLRYKDFATGEMGDWVDFTAKKFGLTRRVAIIKTFVELIRSPVIDFDSKVVCTYHSKHKNASIGLKTGNYKDVDLDYWNTFGITRETLDLYNVIVAEIIWVNDKIIYHKKKGELIFAYLINGKIKIYRPFALKKDKWLGNTNKDCIFGLEQLKVMKNRDDKLIVTKSLKDVMLLKELGYKAISSNAETVIIGEEIMNELLEDYTVYILLDNDKTGIDMTAKWQEKYPTVVPLSIPTDSLTKDISDFYAKYGKDKTIQLLEYEIVRANQALANDTYMEEFSDYGTE